MVAATEKNNDDDSKSGTGLDLVPAVQGSGSSLDRGAAAAEE
jgi:hypothetical protein